MTHYRVALFEHVDHFAQVGVEHYFEAGKVWLTAGVVDGKHRPDPVNDDNLRLAPWPVSYRRWPTIVWNSVFVEFTANSSSASRLSTGLFGF